MGVRGLQTFLEQYCPHACYSVDIGKLAREYKSRTGNAATIVIDAQSCYSIWYEGIDWFVGFEIQEYIHRLTRFVKSFKNLGIKLIFFFGGLTSDKKRDAWILRRRKNLREVHQVFDILRIGQKDIPSHINSLPPNMGFTTSFILKYVLDCEVHMSVEECDEEIIDFVQEHDCFAVFGQDSDFVISQINAVVLSSRKFNIKTMTTLLYDRIKLAEHLKIDTNELPLLALIAGNDLIPLKNAQEFHRHLCRIQCVMIPFHVLMPAIGVYINQLPKNMPLEDTLKRISMDLFGDDSQLELLKMSYDSYFVRKIEARSAPKDQWSRIVHIAKYRHKTVITPSILYSILNDQIFECSTAFEDLRVTHDGNAEPRDRPSSTVTRPLRLRLYGILLLEKESVTITVQEWCGDNLNSYLKPVIMEPVKPTVQHPGLITLWSDNNSERINNMRWQLFLSSVCPTLKMSYWKSLDDDLLLTTLSVYYLCSMKFLDKSEVAAVLATIAIYPLYSRQRLYMISYEDMNFRAAHISLTLIRTYGIILTLLAACGFPISLSPDAAFLKFEGKLFQIKYADSMKPNSRYNDLCDNNSDSLKTFYKMKRMLKPFI